MDNILDACRKTGADCVHPGYGFLSENTNFAALLEKNNITFIGPRSSCIHQLGDKLMSKKLAREIGVSTVPGHAGVVESVEEARKVATAMGFPVMLKAVSGGGGKGMRVCWDDHNLEEDFKLCTSEAQNNFSDGRLLVEKFIVNPRHIEIQVMGDNHGNVLYFPERECSVQRRNQKVVEEAPSSFLTPDVRRAMGEQAAKLAKHVGYNSAGTVEFMVDASHNFYFLEMNTRLQVEHPITEYITGVDLVELMISSAANKPLPLKQSDIKINGWATECRVYAENPYKNFMPSPGKLAQYIEPEHENDPHIRVDTGVVQFSEIPVYYDPLIAKLAVWGENRKASIEKMKTALESYVIQGVKHNVSLLWDVINQPRYIKGDIATNFLPQVYPKGFPGTVLNDTLSLHIATTAAIHKMMAIRREFTVVDNDGGAPQHDNVFIVLHDNKIFNFEVYEENPDENPFQFEVEVTVGDNKLPKFIINANHFPGNPLFLGKIMDDKKQDEQEEEEEGPAVKEEFLTQIFKDNSTDYRVAICGSEFKTQVYTPTQYVMSRYMPKHDASVTLKKICSEITGVVISVAVQPGDKIYEGMTVAVVEAMKMQNPMHAARDGVVKKVYVVPGGSVAADQCVIELE
eukprot:gnl/Spiro4/7327_TR3839_c0_g1_i1.p1 gnl/Spiro4/7327_TR3839_c0_g1~~gnl/Spiro4/7327_TR3839_c0_g1_i1.p1  ORF type:complete len:735 (+),score=226.03 gnl/Spiro4/7327_TR3839_c0_g1_i1:321-2207(+)